MMEASAEWQRFSAAFGAFKEDRSMGITESAREIARHLNTYRDNVRNARPVIVSMHGEEWAGARYIRTDSGTEMVYLVGKLPAYYRLGTGKWARTQHVYYSRPSRLAFRLAGDDRDWYVAGYNQNPDAGGQYAPFGRYWQLCPWTSEQPIDHGEGQYTRKPFAMIDA